MSAVDHERAPAKLTRSLRVTGRRDDGYHLLESEMASLNLADELEIDERGEGLEVIDELAWSGMSRPPMLRPPLGVVAGPDNLVRRALDAVGRTAHVVLRKHIPAGAGLGGGSADAAAVLRWAGSFEVAVATRLGADVPFCLRGGRAFVRGTGEVVEPLAFEAFSVVLLTPPLGASTPAVYRAWDELGGPVGTRGNDLEPAALQVEPRLGWWRDLFTSVAGEPPRLAGSGSTWYLECAAGRAAALAEELRASVRSAGRQALVTAASSTPGR